VRVCSLDERINPHRHAWRHAGNGFDSHGPVQSSHAGVAGFGAAHRLHSAHILEISDHLPIQIEFIESREKTEAILPELEKLIGSGLIEMQETTVIVHSKG